jgi:hypothetical protein
LLTIGADAAQNVWGHKFIAFAVNDLRTKMLIFCVDYRGEGFMDDRSEHKISVANRPCLRTAADDRRWGRGGPTTARRVAAPSRGSALGSIPGLWPKWTRKKELGRNNFPSWAKMIAHEFVGWTYSPTACLRDKRCLGRRVRPPYEIGLISAKFLELGGWVRSNATGEEGRCF